MCYDVKPVFSFQGVLAWLSIKPEGYEADKQDLVVKFPTGILNLTKNWDGMRQGVPQSPLTQSYSFRWIFNLWQVVITLLLHQNAPACEDMARSGMNKS